MKDVIMNKFLRSLEFRKEVQIFTKNNKGIEQLIYSVSIEKESLGHGLLISCFNLNHNHKYDMKLIHQMSTNKMLVDYTEATCNSHQLDFCVVQSSVGF